MVLTPDHFADLVRMVNEELATKTEAAEQELTTVEAQLAEARAKLARLYDAIETGVVSTADLGPRIRPRKEQVDTLLAARARLVAHPGGVPVLQVSEAQVEAHVAGLRALQASGSIGKRRAFLTAWVRSIEVHGTDLRPPLRLDGYPVGSLSGLSARRDQGGHSLLSSVPVSENALVLPVRSFAATETEKKWSSE